MFTPTCSTARFSKSTTIDMSSLGYFRKSCNQHGGRVSFYTEITERSHDTGKGSIGYNRITKGRDNI